MGPMYRKEWILLQVLADVRTSLFGPSISQVPSRLVPTSRVPRPETRPRTTSGLQEGSHPCLHGSWGLSTIESPSCDSRGGSGGEESSGGHDRVLGRRFPVTGEIVPRVSGRTPIPGKDHPVSVQHGRQVIKLILKGWTTVSSDFLFCTLRNLIKLVLKTRQPRGISRLLTRQIYGSLLFQSKHSETSRLHVPILPLTQS